MATEKPSTEGKGGSVQTAHLATEAESSTEERTESQRKAAESSRKSSKDSDGNETTVDDPQARASSGLDSEVAVTTGLTEGEIKALRDEAGLNQSAGHTPNLLAWEATQAGQDFLSSEKQRQTAVKEEAKRLQSATNDDGLDPAAAKYVEVLEQGRKNAAK